MKLVDLSYCFEKTFKHPEELLKAHYPTTNFLEALAKILHSVTAIRSLRNSSAQKINNVNYIFTAELSASKFVIPSKLHKQIKLLQPDVVLLHGLMYPLQVIHLRKVLGNKCVICIQHHAEKPAHGIKRHIQSMQFKHINAFFFTSQQQGFDWFQQFKKVTKQKIFELPEGSSTFKYSTACEKNLSGMPVLLCVSNLTKNKDPLTLLKGFALIHGKYPEAHLHFVFIGNELLQEAQTATLNLGLQKSVTFHGKIEHAILESVYASADYFVSGSHYEGTGFALIEAISCGCIPVVTSIPSHSKLTNQGTLGMLWKAGDPIDFATAFFKATQKDRNQLRAAGLEHFTKNLSYESLAIQIQNYFKILLA